MKVYIVMAEHGMYDAEPAFIREVFKSEESAIKYIQEQNLKCVENLVRFNMLWQMFNQDLLTKDEIKEMQELELHTIKCHEHVYVHELLE